MLIILIILAFVLWRYGKSAIGKSSFSRFKFSVPYLGTLYTKMYLSRISDNMDTMLESGIPMIKSIEVTADVVGDDTYKKILLDAVNQIKGGSSFSSALEQYPEIPRIIIQMSKIGEETGKLGFVLKTMARFYKREVDGAVDTLVGLIEPVMIVVLGFGVGILLVSVLMPIYNMAGSIS